MARKVKSSSDCQLVGEKVAARLILEARERFNDALEARNMAAIEHVLSEDAVLVPGDDAQLINGRAAQLEAWQSIYENMDSVRYVRSPGRIEVSEDGHLAAETGRWTGGWTSQGMQISYMGRYFAKWRLEELVWKIEAETFVTIKRTGGML
ncbi:nuclear transport factor 2 family protein [Maricaulis sp. MIT060901]|uniref:nuclear transport factor 2 family protein n=1 Tax=Maricaulis sp. MIT060901 TaxID=3096993 RepID=UPI00399B8CD8